MRFVASLALGFSLAAAAYMPAFGQATGMKNGSDDTNTTKARCSPGDPNVLLNVKNKTYMLDKSKSLLKPAGSMSGSMSSSMKTSGAATGNSTMKSICKSEAESMGAKMAGPKH